MYTLYIANKNYSSWSLRPWLLMRELRIPFEERLIPFGQIAEWDTYRRICPSGKVPCLVDEQTVVWDSLAIVEYLNERHEGVWPAERTVRAWARSAAAEMHSGFTELRSRCSMSCGVRVRLHETPPELTADIQRLTTLWTEGLNRFGGPFLAGEQFTAVDAFFAPVVFRIQTYGLQIDSASRAYADRMLQLQTLQDWYTAALNETLRDEPHDRLVAQTGAILQDLRAPARPS